MRRAIIISSIVKLFAIFFASEPTAFAQDQIIPTPISHFNSTFTPTSLPSINFIAAIPDSTNGWGYKYSDLKIDLSEWAKSPYAKVESVGVSTHGRAIWMVSISDAKDSLGYPGNSFVKKSRVMIHARTHPAEVQANYISNEAIKFLLGPSAIAAQLRSEFIFNIIPMYNPDGVEEGHSRLNGRLVDLESNWDKPILEVEVQTLKNLFLRLMNGPIPIQVALNLHSDQYLFSRFFVYHLPSGTSLTYSELEKRFIEKSQSHFQFGIRDWDFYSTWPTTKTQYPESFWWLNYREKVLALTYEDTNEAGANKFDSTALALVLGSADFIRENPATKILVNRKRMDDQRILLTLRGIKIPSGYLNLPHGGEMISITGKILKAEKGVSVQPIP